MKLACEIAEKRMWEEIAIELQDGSHEILYTQDKEDETIYSEEYQNIFDRHYDKAMEQLESLNKEEEYFEVTSVHRDDLIEVGISIKDIDLLDDSDMETIASKMSNAYIENSYWIDLAIIAEYIISEKKKTQE